MSEGERVAAARAGDAAAFAALVAPHQRGLRLYAWRMVGSTVEAEDLLQDTLERAWKAVGAVQDPTAVRAWLYTILHHRCVDRSRRRRCLPLDLGARLSVGEPPGAPDPDGVLEPFPGARLPPDPEQRALSRESLTLSFQELLQRMPPSQRAAYVLRELVELSAEEAGNCLGLSATAVHSAVARAREAVARAAPAPLPVSLDRAAQFAAAFEARDVDALVALLHEDVVLAMPPVPGHYAGRPEVLRFVAEHLFPGAALRCVLTWAGRDPAVALYRAGAPAAILVLHESAGRLRTVEAFLLPGLFPLFDLPATPRSRQVVSTR
jgi:RNA polymerase sigma-70 factor, ECF subfamily